MKLPTSQGRELQAEEWKVLILRKIPSSDERKDLKLSNFGGL